MRRRCFLLAVLLAGVATLDLSLWQSRCFADPESAKVLQAEFVQPPKIFVRHTAAKPEEYCSPEVVQLASGKLVMPGWKFESADGGRTWTPLETDAWLDSRSVIRLRDGRWAGIFSRANSLGQGGSQPTIRFSSDEAKNWSEPVDLAREEAIWYIQNQRLIETSKKVLVAAFCRGGGKYEGDNNVAGCFYSTDGGKTWSLSETLARLEDDERGMQEPLIVELADGRLYMLARTGKGSHHRSYSNDGGRTWSAPQPTTLTAACSPLAMKTMPDGRLLVVYNHAKQLKPGSLFPRRPLVWTVSSDGGTTWGPPHAIDVEAGQEHIYPSITFLEHGILIVYTSFFNYDDGRFGGPPDRWKIGGGKSCILKYPRDRKGGDEKWKR